MAKKNNNKVVNKKYMVVNDDGVILDNMITLEGVHSVIRDYEYDGSDVGCFTVYKIGDAFAVELEHQVTLVPFNTDIK